MTRWALGLSASANGGLALYAALTNSFTLPNGIGSAVAIVCIALLLTEGRSP